MRLKAKKFMALAMSALIILSQFSFVLADEGMFMLDKIATLPLKQRGLKLRPTDIYNPAGGSLHEAVIRLSIGCTGEFVSPEGLILTNHHCGFDALVAASTPEADYGKNGYKANDRRTELPAKNYSITITQIAEDVTPLVTAGIAPTATFEERQAAISQKVEQLQTEAQKTAPKDTRIQIQALNDGAFFYKFQYLTIRDIRIVYAPPKNIGFYGGDPDNFEYPRHAGDFTFMRAYVAPDGAPAEYSANNVPYKPRKFLTINTAGIRENDFQFVMGYPGGTTRYRESFSVSYNQDTRMPFIVDYFSAQIRAYEEASRTNPEKAVKYQGEIFNLANTVKAFDGGVASLKRADLISKKRAQEAQFATWLNGDPARKAKYGEVLSNLESAYKSQFSPSAKTLILQFLPNGDAPWQIALFAAQVALEREKPEAQRRQRLLSAAQETKSGLDEVIKNREPYVERETLRFLLRRAAELPAAQRIAAFDKRFASLQGEPRRLAEDEFVRTATEGERFTTSAGLGSLLDMNPAQMRALNNPVIDTMLDLAAELAQNQAATAQFNSIVTRYRPLLLLGMSEMNRTSPYPDANSTLRFTFGNVKGYSPRDAVILQPFTDLQGVFEKNTGREPFDAPPKLIELYRRKDYGTWGAGGRMPVDFLNTTDIIGGNSGSPVLNDRGEQVGIVFDGNYEGLGNDFFVNPDLGRTIAVDIRYVLFITEKFGDAGWILKELNIKRK